MEKIWSRSRLRRRRKKKQSCRNWRTARKPLERKRQKRRQNSNRK